ncbi:MAG: glucose-6-phosphate isomerase [Deltaproteobacteria bacterium]|nr:MAG: glucose-6-phosphate isomerase [Deltaproteobacteria bacterium]
MEVKVDLANLYEERAGEGGIPRREWEAFLPQAQRAWWRLQEARSRGEMAFLDLPYMREMDQVIEVSKRFRGRFDPVVLLGIGGSCLGPQALAEAVFHPWMRSEGSAGAEGPRAFFLDNVDPSSCRHALEVAQEGNPLVIVISKSGTTVETLAQFLLFLDMLKRRFSDWRERIVVITDPEKGPLRAFATEEGLTTLPIPPKVGGRFSVLSAVGIFPAYALGIEGEEILLGAVEADRALRAEEGNPALETASLLYLLHTRMGKGIWVTCPYGDALEGLAAWRAQLIGESLGKREDIAPTPVSARGTTDQHSQLQLWLEGPRDKVFTFLRLKGHPLRAPIPEVDFPAEEAESLKGKEIGELLEAERRATQYVLTQRGRPNYTVTLSGPTPKALGALFFMWEVETVLLGSFYGVNPFDQPAVEKGKRLTWGLMGRKGFEAEREEIEAWGG